MEVAKPQPASLGGGASLPPDDAEPDPLYRATLNWVWSFSARPRSPQEMAAQRAVKLERMRALLDTLDRPELTFPSLLVAGTKGKGSTVAMLDACLRAAGYRVGRYTSPHLVNWRERTYIDGEPISTDDVISLAETVRDAVERVSPELGAPTTFEVGTALALLQFARKKMDLAVVEVGTGGRFDATNLVNALVSVITPISYDHTATLGSTLTSIASHKAGIIRQERPVIVAPQPEEARTVLVREAARVHARLEEVGRDWFWSSRDRQTRIESTRPDFEPLTVEVGLLGDHQRDNATAAVAALHAFGRPISRDAIRVGLRQVDWPGRLQVLSERPLIVLDGAHNAASAEVVRRAVDGVFDFDRLTLVIGVTEGKDALGVLRSLAPRAARVLLTRSHHEHAADPAGLEPLVASVAPEATVSTFSDVASALRAALETAETRDLVLVTGSLFVVGEALVWWRSSPR